MSINLHSQKYSWSWWKRIYFLLSNWILPLFSRKNPENLSALCKILAEIDCNNENFTKPFNTSGFSLVLLMFRSFPLNLDCNLRRYEKKCSKETLKLNKEKDFLQMCSNIEQNTSIPRKSSPERHKKPQLDSFYWLSSDYLTHIISHESASNTQLNQQWPSPHVAEIEGKGVETSFFVTLIKSKDLKNW